MRAEDLRVLELIQQDPGTGFPLLGSARFIMVGMAPLGRLRRDLRDLLGDEGSRKLMMRFGYEAGLGLATILSELYDWESDLEWLKAGCLLRGNAGWARDEPGEMTLDKAQGVFRFSGRWLNSFEAALHLKSQEVAPSPVCDVLCGMVSGYASAMLGAEVLVRETSCLAMGHECCKYEARPVAEWGLSAEEMRQTLSISPVAEEVNRLQAALRKAKSDLEHSSREILRLQSAGERQPEEPGLIFRGAPMAQLLELARKVAPTMTTVLMNGETGTGKEVLARYLHRHSGRQHEPYLAINCAALPPNLLESELFGHVRGAFTGADRDKKGLFVEAGAGTLFLDEVGELPLELQAKLLRALQEREVRPVGGVKDQPVHARIVAATNRDLKEMVAQGRFREDLYYRLAVIPMAVPPLRQRRADILPLARHFLARFQPQSQGFAPEAVRIMEAHAWPGNVRELENAVEYASVLAGVERITPAHLPLELLKGSGDPLASLAADLPGEEELLKRYTQMVLKHTGGNKAQAARLMGIGANTLWRRLKTQDGGEAQA